MSVRLTKKKQKEILSRIDQIIMLHRGKIYVALGGHDPTKIDRTTITEVIDLIDDMGIRLYDEIKPILEKLVEGEAPVLPLK